TYAIEVCYPGGKYSRPLSSEAFDTAAVTVRKSLYVFSVNTSRAGDGVLAVTILREVNRFEDDSVIPHAMTGVNGLYSVTFTPSTRHPTYATISFNSTELPLSPVKLDSYCPAPPVRPEQLIARADNEPTQQHPLPGSAKTPGSPLAGTATTPGSSQNGSMSGQDILDCTDHYCAMDEDCLTFCFLRCTVNPVRRDSYCQAPPGRQEQSIARASHTDSKPIQQHPLPGTKTTSGSSQNGPMPGNCSDEDSAAYVDMNQHRHSFDSYSTGVSRSQAKRSS
ncbi:hypothetical protein NP493_1955g00011, partial [Ridgeia piscesae]